jgi:hypothetical protein
MRSEYPPVVAARRSGLQSRSPEARSGMNVIAWATWRNGRTADGDVDVAVDVNGDSNGDPDGDGGAPGSGVVRAH